MPPLSTTSYAPGRHCQYHWFCDVQISEPCAEVGSHSVSGHGASIGYAGLPLLPPHLHVQRASSR